MNYQAPTIVDLAALLDEASPPRPSVLVPLKAGTKNPPVFMVPGLDGNIMEFVELLRHIGSPHPAYGMQARGMDGIAEPFERVEDMAQFYFEAIQEVQPRGPYLLIGYSFGGLVTLEIARRLSEKGEKVALLALLESYPHRRRLPMGQRMRLHIHRAKNRASRVVRGVHGGPKNQPGFRPSLSAAMQRVHDSSSLALERYRPLFYSGKIKFVSQECKKFSTDNPYAVYNPTAVWGHLAREFEIETVPGDHLGIIMTHFESLASVLSRYLEEALSQSGSHVGE
jgi:thioesterase domain-containing protein